MGYVIPAGYSRVSFDYSGASSTGSLPSWGFGVSIGPDEGFLSDLQEWWADEMRPTTNAGITLNRIEMRNDFEVKEVLPSASGGRSGEYASPQVAALVKFSSGLTGRQNRGRIFWPYLLLDSEVNGSGEITPTRHLEIDGYATELAAFVLAHTAELVILHSTELTPTVVTSISASPQVATQRRRNRR